MEAVAVVLYKSTKQILDSICTSGPISTKSVHNMFRKHTGNGSKDDQSCGESYKWISSK